MKIVGDPECPLCGGLSSRADAFFPEFTDGLPVDPVRQVFHPIGLHWPCYLPWPGRPEFARGLFARLVRQAADSRLWGRAHLDGQLAVLVSVAEPHGLRILLATTGRSLVLATPEWNRWRTNPELVAPACHSAEREALRGCLAPVWERFPDAVALVAGTDWTGTDGTCMFGRVAPSPRRSGPPPQLGSGIQRLWAAAAELGDRSLEVVS